MLWYLVEAGADRRQIILADCQCARLALRYLPENEHRPRIGIETAERWAKDMATRDELEVAFAGVKDVYNAIEAAAAAEAAVYVNVASAKTFPAAYGVFRAAAHAAAYAAKAAVNVAVAFANTFPAAYAAEAVAYATEAAFFAAEAVAYAGEADIVYDAASAKAVLTECADIVRIYFPKVPKYRKRNEQ